jgi:thiol-disulfide isomerase/thioredoxin
MKKTFPFLFLAAALAANAAAQSGRRGITPPPLPPAPTLSEPPIQPERAPVASAELRALPASVLTRQLKSLDKGSFSLSDFGGKVLVVNLWASWCGPCRREVPEYEKVRKEYAGRAVEFIALTAEDPNTSSNRVKQFVRDFNFGFRMGWADRETAATLMNGRNAIPQTLVIATDGRILSHWRGYSPGQGRDRLREAIEHALSDTPTQTRNLQ